MDIQKMKDLIEQKKLRGSNRKPRYATRKLTIGLVSCMLGFTLLISPSSVLADEAVVDDTTVAEGTSDGTPTAETVVETPTTAEGEEDGQEETQAEVGTPAKDEGPKEEVNSASAQAANPNTEEKPAQAPAGEVKTEEEKPEEKPAKEEKTQADTFAAEIKTLETKVGEAVNYEEAITNLPEGAFVAVKEAADISEAGEKEATLEIVFKDGSTKEVKVKVLVEEKVETLDQDFGLDVSGDLFGGPMGSPEDSGKDEEETTDNKNIPENRNPKTNWDEEAGKGDERNWPVDFAGGQRLLRVTESEPTQITDLNYDGTYTNADGRDAIKLLYKEKSQSVSSVWYRMVLKFDSKLFNQIDWEASYGEGTDAKQYKFVDANGKNEKWLDLGLMTGPKAQSRRNLPIHLVLKDGTTIKALGEENYSVQMRLMDDKFQRIYAMAPKGSSMDYTTYTKSTTIPLANDIDMAFYKGGKAQSIPYALQNGFYSSYVADPTENKELSYIYRNYEKEEDLASLAVLSTQYQAQRAVLDPKDLQEGKPAAYVQIFDANFADYLKPDKNGNIAYTNVLNWSRKTIASNKVGIKKEQINYKYDEKGNKKFAYVVLASSKFNNSNVKNVVRVHNDNFWKILNEQNGYTTTVDYMVDKKEFADTFKTSGKNKVDFPIMSGWVDSNPNGWAVYERTFDKDMVLPKGYKTPIVDTGVDVKNDGVLFQVGDPNDALVRRPQGYYNGSASDIGGLDQINNEKVGGQYSYTLREGATIKKGDKVRVLLQDYGKENLSVNFYNLETGTEKDQSKPVLSLSDGKNGRILTTHIYKDYNTDRGYYKVKYIPKGKTEEASFEFKIVGTGTVKWEATDNNMITGLPNKAVTPSQGNFQIDLSKVEPGTNLIIESYNSKGELQKGETASMTFEKFERVDNYTDLAWLDLMDNISQLSLKKSLYRPYQDMFTNDYAMTEAAADKKHDINQIYRDPRSLPTTEDAFKHDTESVQGFTRYDGATLRLLYVDKDGKRYIAKANADKNDYDKDGNITKDATKKVKVYDKDYDAFPYEVFLKQFDPTRNGPVPGETFKLYKDMRFLANTSDGSSVPSDWLEVRVKTRVLFDTTDGAFEGGKKKDVRIVPDNVKFFDEKGYKANGFTGKNVAENTGDEFVANPTAQGKTFLGWVTEAGKTALGNKTVTTADAFKKLAKDTEKFTAETPVERHQVVYAVWTTEEEATPEVDKSALQTEVAKDSTTKEDVKYTNASDEKKTAYDEALTKANEVLADENATQEQVDAAKQALIDAREALDGKATQEVDKKPLQDEVDKKDDTKASDKYKNADQDKKDAYDKALEDAQKVLDKEDATQEEVDKAKEDLTKAEEDLNGKTDDGDKPGTGDSGSTDKPGSSDDDKPGTGDTGSTDKPGSSDDDKPGTGDSDSQDPSKPSTDDKTDDKSDEDDGKDSKEDGKTDADNNPAVAPDKTEVEDSKNLTDKEKAEVAEKVAKANPDVSEVRVDNKGNATLVYPDGSMNTIGAARTVVEKSAGTVAPSKDNKEYPRRDNKGNKLAGKNVKTGLGSVSGLIGLAGAAAAGLFASKKKEDEEDK